ncbi:MAG TPA: DUF1801 domain-containing protein [Thermoanaerobaculia bacterium]|nr:DUF1801 domain-containing protein [Thermoanaerobaculia bacterium]
MARAKRSSRNPERWRPGTIDGYLARLTLEKRAALQKLRGSIQSAAPRAEECISYGIPAFRLDGRVLVWFGAATRHCSFFPGAVIEEFEEELAGYDTSKGTVRFSPDEPLPASLVRRLVKARAARIAAPKKRPIEGRSARAESSRGKMTLREAVRILDEQYGKLAGPPTSDPFELVLWENVAYLASPGKRREAFEQLRKTVGTTPAAIAGAPDGLLEKVTARGILWKAFAEKLRACARIALEEHGGDLAAVVRGPLPAAKRALRAYPGIGEPGAEKILLFAGRDALLAPDSNGLRVLARLGFAREEKSYAKTYAAARDAAKALPPAVRAMQKAHLLLQEHGRALCKRTAPRCEACPLTRKCAYALGAR